MNSMENDGRSKSAANYKMAVARLKEHIGSEDMRFT
jgi:hypothetical protein